MPKLQEADILIVAVIINTFNLVLITLSCGRVMGVCAYLRAVKKPLVLARGYRVNNQIIKIGGIDGF